MNQNLTEIAIVLDRSGSMDHVRSATIAGVNEFLSKQRAVPGDALVTLHLFDDQHEWPHKRVTLRDVPDLTERTYVPRGMTAMNDAIAQTIDHVGAELALLEEANRPAKVIVLIVTDGLENSSKTFSTLDVARRIQHQRDRYGWEFVFLGANQDAIITANRYNIDAKSALTYNASAQGVQSAFASAAVYTATARVGEAAQFSQEDRTAAMDGTNP